MFVEARLQESQPLRFIDRFVLPALADVTRELARYLHCPAWELALVSNATTALNAVIHSISLRPGDRVFLFDTAYGVWR
jgi:isopenicillin-N epimerase